MPLALFALAWSWLVVLRGDQRIADAIYAWEGGRWALRSHVATEILVHRFGRAASVLAGLGVAGLLLVARRSERLRAWRAPLVALLLSVVASTMLIAVLKHATAVHCPWDLARYGGTHAYVGLFEALPPGVPAGGCFPAAHAGAGYAWVALYFFFARVRPRLRGWGLATGLAAGFVFGIAQQLRGAHFLSHDATALAISWFASLALHHASCMLEASNAGPAP